MTFALRGPLGCLDIGRQRERIAWSAALLLAALMMSGCTSQKLLSADFDNDSVGDPPAIDQEVGRCRTGLFGDVSVENFADGRWVRLTQGDAELLPPAELHCSCVAQRRDGHYLFTMRLFIPTGSFASVSFQDAGFDPTTFFEIEFPATGVLQAPGSTAIAGRFPRNKTFSLAVNLTIGEISTVEVTLLGAASGSFIANVEPHLVPFARNFKSIELNTRSINPGSMFFANDLVVLYSQQPLSVPDQQTSSTQ
jgi:hypothetical protein